MISNTFWEKNMIGSTFWVKNMIGSNFCGKNMTDSTSRKKHDWQRILGTNNPD
jgi:hypothetical protein